MRDDKNIHALFDGSFDGFLSIVHARYYDGLDPSYISCAGAFQQALGAQYALIETDFKKSETVFDALHKKISNDAARTVYHAFHSSGPERFMHIFRYILLGFKTGEAVDRYMSLDYVFYTQKASRYVGGEAHLLTGFIRFAESAGGVLYARIGPVNDVLPLVANHFADRLMNEQWIIHDEKRKRVAVYDGENFVIADVPNDASFDNAEDEAKYNRLWRSFYETIAIQSRVNPKLQRTHLPLRYRKYMLEFNKK
jgi:probable DNA metabolism protein